MWQARGTLTSVERMLRELALSGSQVLRQLRCCDARQAALLLLEATAREPPGPFLHEQQACRQA